MDPRNIPTVDDATNAHQPLVYATLIKSTEAKDDEPWIFEGVASDESQDIEGDTILKKSIDLSYAKARGYVNWDHSREPENQLGYLMEAEILDGKQSAELKKAFPQLSDGASVYVKGQLYPEVPKAMDVRRLLKSAPQGSNGLGLSLDGTVARDVKSGGIEVFDFDELELSGELLDVFEVNIYLE